MIHAPHLSFFFFFNDPAPTEISPLSLHAALPISEPAHLRFAPQVVAVVEHLRTGPLEAHHGLTVTGHRRPRPPHVLVGIGGPQGGRTVEDRKSTRLNSSHSQISYAVFCLKKKK